MAEWPVLRHTEQQRDRGTPSGWTAEKDLHQQDNAVLACLIETGHDFANATIRIELDDVSSGDPLTEHNAAITFTCEIGNV